MMAYRCLSMASPESRRARRLQPCRHALGDFMSRRHDAAEGQFLSSAHGHRGGPTILSARRTGLRLGHRAVEDRPAIGQAIEGSDRSRRSNGDRSLACVPESGFRENGDAASEVRQKAAVLQRLPGARRLLILIPWHRASGKCEGCEMAVYRCPLAAGRARRLVLRRSRHRHRVRACRTMSFPPDAAAVMLAMSR